MLTRCLEADLVPFIKGPPAIGKSDIVRQVADEYNLKVLDFRLSQADTTDMNGLPTFNEDKSKAQFVPMDTFPVEGDPLPVNEETGKKYAGWLLFLDELNSAQLSIQAAAFKLVLDRQVGKYNLHPHVRVIAAGNREIDKGIVNRLSTPMQSRLMHFELTVDSKAWLKWAGQNDIDYRIMSFIGFKPQALYDFKPDHNKDTYASPRTWEFVNRIVKGRATIPSDDIPLIAGAVDEAAAREFYSYAQIFKSLVTIPQIIAAPDTIKVPEEPSVMFALSGSIGEHINEKNVVPLMAFLGRVNIEFQILAMQLGISKNTKLIDAPAIQQWISKYQRELY